MSRIAYVNRQFVPQSDAFVAMEDRGYQFADGIYEVAAFLNRRLLDAERHLDRMEYSLRELAIPMPMSRRALMVLIDELISRNSREAGLIYLQITRGVSARNHTWPSDITPALTMNVLPVAIASDAQRAKGMRAITAPDERWARCDIKSISLLPNILARKKSYDVGARETILVNAAGEVTEGSATNIFFIDGNGTLVTHPKNHAILGGITRDVVLELARNNGVKAEERPFMAAEILAVREVFFTSTSAFVMPIIEVDGKPVGNGAPGLTTSKLIELYNAHVAHEVSL
jgi:D-alanine transaminase